MAKPKPGSKPQPPRAVRPKMGLWHAVRDIGCRSIDRGAVVPVGLVAFMLIVAWRLPVTALAELVNRIVSGLQSGWLLGYLGMVLMGAGWRFHIVWLRRNTHGELRRVIEVRDELQSKETRRQLESSE